MKCYCWIFLIFYRFWCHLLIGILTLIKKALHGFKVIDCNHLKWEKSHSSSWIYHQSTHWNTVYLQSRGGQCIDMKYSKCKLSVNTSYYSNEYLSPTNNVIYNISIIRKNIIFERKTNKFQISIRVMYFHASLLVRLVVYNIVLSIKGKRFLKIVRHLVWTCAIKHTYIKAVFCNIIWSFMWSKTQMNRVH